MPSHPLPNEAASVARTTSEAVPARAAALTGHAQIAGRSVPPQQLGPLNEVSDWRAVRNRLPQLLERDGYLLLRNSLPVEQVEQARQDVLERLAAVGEIALPLESAVATGTSQREALHPDLNNFWRGVCESPVLRAATHGPALA